MLLLNFTNDINILLFTYMFIYNLSLISFFWTLFNLFLTKIKTLYSFNNYTYTSFYNFIITILIFSMAGVPPFLGFFSKLFILILLINNTFFIFYFIFFLILFSGLYFYIQNMRFLHSTKAKSNSNFYILNSRNVLAYYYFIINILIIIIFGFYFIDDFLLIFSWILK